MIGVMKNKTLATWLTWLGGPLGLHRFYLYGPRDVLAWGLPIPTALGMWGVTRVQSYGLDDVLSWWLFPIFGFSMAACCLNAIVYGLMTTAQWNAHFNPNAQEDDASGNTSWLTIWGVIIALILGATVLISSIVYSFQRYFEVQIQEAHRISIGE
jgi:hypothetical protein